MRVRHRGLWLKPLAKRLEIIGGCLPPVVHLVLTGSRDASVSLDVTTEMGTRGAAYMASRNDVARLNWTIARKAVAREARARSSFLDLGREGVKFESQRSRSVPQNP